MVVVVVSLHKIQTAMVVFQMKKPKICHRNRLLAFFLVFYCRRFFVGLNWTHRLVIGLNVETVEELVEFGCLETKTLNFCKDSEYRADISKSKTSKQRQAKNLQKPSNVYLPKHFLNHKTGYILARAVKRH